MGFINLQITTITWIGIAKVTSVNELEMSSHVAIPLRLHPVSLFQCDVSTSTQDIDSRCPDH